MQTLFRLKTVLSLVSIVAHAPFDPNILPWIEYTVIPLILTLKYYGIGLRCFEGEEEGMGWGGRIAN